MMTRLGTLALVLLLGCPQPAPVAKPGDDDDDVVVPEGDDDDDDNIEIPTFDTYTETGTPGDTAPVGETGLTFLVPPNPQTMTLGYSFGWDPVTRTTSEVVITVGAQSTTMAPTIDINLGDATWTGDVALVDNYCTVFLPLYDATEDAAFEATSVRHDMALLYDPILNPGTTDCFDGLGAELDPLLWGTGLAIYLGNLGPWAVAIGDPDGYTLSVLSPYLTTDVRPEHLIGGTLRDSGFLNADIPEIYGFAWQVEPSFDVILDASYALQPILLSQIPEADTVRQAWYDMNSLYIWSFY